MTKPILLTPERLRRVAPPQPEDGASQARGKDLRGRVLIVAGAPDVPGAVILAAEGALRAGAGKLQIATGESVARHIGVAVPEARVVGLPELASGGLAPASSDRVLEMAEGTDAVLFGPGMTDEPAVVKLLAPVLSALAESTTVVLDAAALACLSEDAHCLRRFGGNAVLTPHTVEMSLMLGIDEQAVTDDPLGIALKAATQTQAFVALKGAETFIASPDGRLYVNRAGNIGLAVSGSGDTLAGIVVGLAGRAGAEEAALWGVYLHGKAGEVLARRVGPLGYLAREVPGQIPALMHELHKASKK